MSQFEEEFIKAINEEKIICYEKCSFDRLTYWTSEKRSKNILFDNNFFDNMSNYCYLGIPVREVIKNVNAMGHCYSCAIALSLRYDKFAILVANLSSYVAYLNHVGESNTLTFEHAVLLINDFVIDTSFGIITDYETYDKIFKLNRISKLSDNDIKDTIPYKYLSKRKQIIAPDFYSEIILDDDYKDYIEGIKYFLNKCSEYRGNNKELEYFYNHCLSINSNINTIKFWRDNISIDVFDKQKIKQKNR